MEMGAVALLEHGFERASMEAVAGAAGVSKMTLYNYFPSKVALLEACVRTRTDAIFDAFDEGEYDPVQPARGLYRLGRQFVSLMRAEDVIRLHRMLYGLVSVHPEVCQTFYEAGPAQINARVKRYLARAQQAGSLAIEDMELAAEQFLALFLGGPHVRATLGIARPTDDEDECGVRENVRLFLARYGVPEVMTATA